MSSLITQTKTWMTQLNKVKPIWFTECGIPVNDPPVSGYQDGGYPVVGATTYVTEKEIEKKKRKRREREPEVISLPLD